MDPNRPATDKAMLKSKSSAIPFPTARTTSGPYVPELEYCILSTLREVKLCVSRGGNLHQAAYGSGDSVIKEAGKCCKSRYDDEHSQSIVPQAGRYIIFISNRISDC